ncbi:MAG: thioesterase domain-containing protein [Gammaproteobacteria bacterium]
MTAPRIIFIPGLNPKPRPAIYRGQLTRVLTAGLTRSRPSAAAWLAAHVDAFRLVAWAYAFYGAYSDIALDMPGVERLLAQPTPSAEVLSELGSLPRKLKRWSFVLGDTWPLLGRWLAPAATRRLMHDANRYLKNRDGIGSAVRAMLRAELDSAWQAGAPFVLIGHSLGSVIAYDTLWELSRERGSTPRVDLFITLGSPLATHFIQRKVGGSREQGAARYPANIQRWVNFTARGDTTALRQRLKPTFAEMQSLGLVESIEDVGDFHNYYRGDLGLNEHDAYGYLWQPSVGAVVGDWVEKNA